MATELTSIKSVVKALGGTVKTAQLVGLNPQAVSNWHARGRIPAGTYLRLSAELERQGLVASPSLWGMAEPKETAA